MARDLFYGDEARRYLQAGMDQLADAVKGTIGPKGRNVLVEKMHGKTIITNEGSGVTSDFELSDITENLGAQMLKEALEEKMNLKKILVLDTAGVSSMYANDGGIIVVV